LCRGTPRQGLSAQSPTKFPDVRLQYRIIIVTGLTPTFGDSLCGFKRLVQIVFGLSISFAASRFVPEPDRV
uniref:TrbC/VirB2 family protein n=1 Tax=Tateyamaria pelophila TaxID=328415 RepID=UPI0037D9DAD7